jgi:hypothetical protein
MPLYFCNTTTSEEIIKKVREENRISVPSQINDTETSLTTCLNDRVGIITSLALNAKAEKNKDKDRQIREKLNKTISGINETLRYFKHLPSKDVPDRRR